MPSPEKFGKFVLLEEVDSTGLGIEFRAAKLGNSGFEKIVSLLKLKPSISSNVEAAKSLMDQVKVAAQLQNPNVIKIFGIGKVESSYYISYEFVEGRSLKGVFTRCRQEGFPFSVDHGLLIASKVCSALEYAHSRRLEGGARYFHGLLNPSSILVSYEGEVRVRGFGYWPSRAREGGAVGDEESLYLSPEQALGGNGDVRSDVFAVGAVLFETVVGRPLREGGGTKDLAGRLAEARLQAPSGDDDSLPKPLADILGRALDEEPVHRYSEIQEMRKAIDTLLFSGDFTPTTFNLAFFMHSLFREDIEEDAKKFKVERESSYAEYLGGDVARASPPPPARPAAAELGQAGPAEASVAVQVSPTPEALRHSATGRDEPHHTATGRDEPPPAPSRLPAGDGMGSVRDGYNEAILGGAPPEPAPHEASAREASVREASPRDAAAGFTFHRQARRGRSPMIVILVVVLAVAAAAAYWFVWRPGRRIPEAIAPQVQAQPTPDAPSPEEVAALARVKELEERLVALEAEKASAEARAAEEAKARIEAEAAAGGRAADPGAVRRAQEEARRRTQADQERAQLEEKRRLEEEKRAEEARLAEQRRLEEARREAARKEAARQEEARREEARRLAALATPSAPPATTPAPAAPATTPPPPAVRAGTLVNLTDPGVVAPVVERAPTPQYPPIALRQRVEGTVELNVLVDENGGVADAQVIAGSGGKVGLNEAAIENVRRRRYRPATKEGVPVKVWIPVRIRFTLPR